MMLGDLMRNSPYAVQHFLDNVVFPEIMRHQSLKISASGQAIGGELLFKRRVGFSGTPSELMPIELGVCMYEKGSDGQMLYVLTSPTIMSLKFMPDDWSVKSVLDVLATAEPPFHALIDTGALITGMSNFEVAKYLITHGLASMDGCVYLDEQDRQMILIRSSMRALPLDQAGISKNRRFSFYDQVHTTGMDIKQAVDARAAITLGKDMTWRDYCQGAYRMRGIGKGQTMSIFVIPEITAVMRSTLKAASTPLPEGPLDTPTHMQTVLNAIPGTLPFVCFVKSCFA